jgi:preprotein translocase subunit SecF
MHKKWVVFVALFIFVFSLTGCATARKKREMELQGLRNQISVLEAQVQTKDEEINGLKDALSKAAEEKEVLTKKKVIGEVKARPNAKQIQVALRNAGYNPGRIDGRLGKQTKDAIRAFQKNNNLAVDGKVGKQTWNLLKEYLYKKVK